MKSLLNSVNTRCTVFHPCRVSMNKNYDKLTELFEEFSNYTESLHTLYLDSVIGYEFINKNLNQRQSEMSEILKNHGFSDTLPKDDLAMSYNWLVGKDVTPISLSPVMSQGNIKNRTKHNGSNYYRLGSQCIIEAYSYWEEYLRLEIGIALGVISANSSQSEGIRSILNKEVTSDFWGDIRYLRNSIVHNKGKANSDTKNCKLLKWFKPEDVIELSYEKMDQIFRQMGKYRYEIQNMSYPPE